MKADSETLAVYAARAADYAKRFAQKEDSAHLIAFRSALEPGACVLDLGCGAGDASALMRKAGLRVDSWDASQDMAAVALANHDLDVRVAVFEDLDATDAYDGIYANFSLLHAPKSAMPGHLRRIAAALKSGGPFHIGLKAGSGEKRDALGRFYAYYEEDELKNLLADAGFAVQRVTHGEEPGLDGTVAPFLIVLARKT